MSLPRVFVVMENFRAARGMGTVRAVFSTYENAQEFCDAEVGEKGGPVFWTITKDAAGPISWYNILTCFIWGKE